MTPDLDLPPLAARLVHQFGATALDADSAEAFAAGAGDRVLFLSGDPVQFPEGLDVAVVLPELQAVFPGRFAVGAVLRHAQEAVARRYGSQRWPALVFLRDGEYVTTLWGMQDWTVFVERVGAALALQTSRAPSIGIPLVSANAPSGAACH
jgi:hydrogenase-1 operon protein HyaE